jgi:nitroreductase
MEFKDVLARRRAVNFFDPEKDLPEPLLRQVVDMAASAPSSFNHQPWSLLVLRDATDKARLRALAWDQARITEAPVTLVVLADTGAWKEGNPACERNWREMTDKGMPAAKRGWFMDACSTLYGSGRDASLAFAVKNAAFFAMSLMYAATSLGLDTHPMDGFDHDGVRRAFNIPDTCWVPLLLSVGWRRPGAVLDPPKWRKSYDEIVVQLQRPA